MNFKIFLKRYVKVPFFTLVYPAETTIIERKTGNLVHNFGSQEKFNLVAEKYPETNYIVLGGLRYARKA